MRAIRVCRARRRFLAVVVLTLLAAAAHAQSPVTLTFDHATASSLPSVWTVTGPTKVGNGFTITMAEPGESGTLTINLSPATINSATSNGSGLFLTPPAQFQWSTTTNSSRFALSFSPGTVNAMRLNNGTQNGVDPNSF